MSFFVAIRDSKLTPRASAIFDRVSTVGALVFPDSNFQIVIMVTPHARARDSCVKPHSSRRAFMYSPIFTLISTSWHTDTTSAYGFAVAVGAALHVVGAVVAKAGGALSWLRAT